MKYSLPLFLAVLFFACTQPKPSGSQAVDYVSQAKELLKTVPIVDTHIDFPEFLYEHNLWYKPGINDHVIANPEGAFDFERAQKGGLSVPFMSIYIPSGFQKQSGRPRAYADSLIQMVQGFVKAHPDKLAIPKTVAEVESNFKHGILNLPMGLENGAPIQKVEDVAYFYRQGVRYVTLTHGKDNQICDSSYDSLHTNGGLSAFGKLVVKEMNRVGIMVDVSHLDDKSIADVLAIATKPVVATHSGLRVNTPDWQRNLTDEQVIAIAKTGGVVQVPFSALFLNNESRKLWLKKVESELEKRKLDVRTPAGDSLIRQYEREQKTRLYFSVKEVADQIDHIVKLAGVDVAGFGSDFDGVGPSMPPDLRDVSMYPNLVAELLRRNYKPEDIRKICGGNLLRVWKVCENSGK